MCKFYSICHLAETPKRNCRTCLFSRPISNGKWTCDFHNNELTHDMQIKGCEDYKENK